MRNDAFGLKAADGDLNVVQDKQGLGLNGQINIPEGRFHAYGQDLIVRKGELLFSGPPDQPYLNIEAIRNPDATEDDVSAGVRVTGLADEPKAEISLTRRCRNKLHCLICYVDKGWRAIRATVRQ